MNSLQLGRERLPHGFASFLEKCPVPFQLRSRDMLSSPRHHLGQYRYKLDRSLGEAVNGFLFMSWVCRSGQQSETH